MAEDLRPWIPLLVGADLVSHAITEFRGQRYTAAATFGGFALLAFAMIFAPSLVGEAGSTLALFKRSPPLLPFAAVAVAASVGLTIFAKLKADLVLKRDATSLSKSLADFATVARARLPRFAPAQSEEVRHVHTDYLDRFGPSLTRIMTGLVARDLGYEGLLETWMGTRLGEAGSLSVPSRAHLASKFFANYGSGLPRPSKWFDKAFLKSVMMYLAIAGVLWFALLVVGSAVGKEDNSPIEISRNELKSPATVLPNRHLTVAQADSLIASLSQITFVHSVKVDAPNTDRDAWDYAAEFVYVFRKAGWTVIGDGIYPTAVSGTGITILFGHPDDWKTSFAAELDAAFARAQIEIHGRGVKPDVPNGQIEFAVGFND